MSVAKSEVFLVQGQRAKGDGNGLEGTIEQLVVVARNRDDVGEVLAANVPDFRMIGSATLKDYEATAERIRAVLDGKSTEWAMLVGPGMDRASR